jgi:hypothetical protein
MLLLLLCVSAELSVVQMGEVTQAAAAGHSSRLLLLLQPCEMAAGHNSATGLLFAQ